MSYTSRLILESIITQEDILSHGGVGGERKISLRDYFLRHRGVRVEGNFLENISEGGLSEIPRSSCGKEYPKKYHRGTTVLQRGITV